MGFNLGHWISNAVESAGREIGSAVHAVVKETGKIAKWVAHIPILGAVISAAFELGNLPFKATIQVAEGKRLDQALMKDLSDAGKDIKTIAPYVQMVIACIPAIGPLASAAIGAAIAICEGESLLQIAEAAAAGAIPGGAIIEAAVNVGVAAMQGKLKNWASAADVGLNAVAEAAGVELPPIAKTAISAGLDCANKLANGEKLDNALLDSTIDQLPKGVKQAAQAARSMASDKSVADVLLEEGHKMIPISEEKRKHFRTALMTGMAVGHAQHLQGIIKQNFKHPAFVGKLKDTASRVANKDRTVTAARNGLKGRGLHGFDVGMGMMQHKLTRFEFSEMRRNMTGEDVTGYDVAASLHIGRVTQKLSSVIGPQARAGYFITHGMRGAEPDQKSAMMAVIAAEPNMRSGAAAAVNQINGWKEPWWDRLLEWLGLRAEPEIADS
jgi:hypothetical protein